MSTVADCVARAFARGAGKEIPLDEKIIINYNLNKQQNRVGESTQGLVNSDKKHKNYKGLRLLIHTDKALLLAQGWGMAPGLLYNLCRDYGVALVRECIYRVAGIGPRYFRQGEDETSQRGRYCRKVILNEAKQRGFNL